MIGCIAGRKLTCLWKMCEHVSMRADSPSAISLRQMGHVLSCPTRRCELSITISGKDSIAASEAP
jgi:hypothetical protein